MRRVTLDQYNKAVQTKRLAEKEMERLCEANGYRAENMDEYGKLKDAAGIAASRIRSYNKQKAKSK
jgi:hypothetical protein